MDTTYNGEETRTPEREESLRQEAVLEESQRYAGFWMRFWAYITDLIIVFSINGLLLIPFAFIEGTNMNLFGFLTAQGIISSLSAYIYFLLMTKYLGQTLGKMLFGLRVIKKDNGVLKWSDVLFREVVGRFIHRSLVITNILYIVVGFTNEKQGIHDMFSDTRVIHERK
ncbi:RDD family protein [Thalassorhabdus alkalitolerans]|uniref:RDD family protein n=1 Tax=Thalassorhabdus alkalitolerans TaxID=2282697 RepID=A0ABW0YRQ9_9BACI